MRVSFVNDKFLPHEQCVVHIEDRGFQFADGVYEVIMLKNGKLVDGDLHLERLFVSLEGLQIKISQDKNYFEKNILELFAKNNLTEGSVYIQITRGSAPRSQNLPQDLNPTIIATVSPLQKDSKKTIDVITHEDIRWKRCNIKSINLIASSLLKQKSIDEGADDAIMIRDGFVTEATFANVFIVDHNDTLITPNADNFILNGITRRRIIQLATESGIKVSECKFSKDELMNAKEVFLSSTTLIVRPVLKIDGKNIKDGKVGDVSQKILELYNNFIG